MDIYIALIRIKSMIYSDIVKWTQHRMHIIGGLMCIMSILEWVELLTGLFVKTLMHITQHKPTVTSSQNRGEWRWQRLTWSTSVLKGKGLLARNHTTFASMKYWLGSMLAFKYTNLFICRPISIQFKGALLAWEDMFILPKQVSNKIKTV